MCLRCCERRRPGRATENWTKLVRKVRAVRKAQRLFAYLGHYLQRFPKGFLERLAKTHPKQQ